MWLVPDQTTIEDRAPYTAVDGTRYPPDFPKAQIAELTPVTLVARPVTAQYQDATYVIGNATQVWTVTNWTQERINVYLKSLVPLAVSMRQAREALIRRGHFTTVAGYIAGMAGIEGTIARNSSMDW